MQKCAKSHYNLRVIRLVLIGKQNKPDHSRFALTYNYHRKEMLYPIGGGFYGKAGNGF